MSSLPNERSEQPTPNPVQIQKFLGGIDEPAARRELIAHARGAGVDEAVLQALARIPEQDYQTPAAVSKAIGELD